MENWNVIILAGGKSSRMGTDKGLVKLKELSMMEHILKTLNDCAVSDILIISNNEEYQKFGYKVYKDIFKEKGPLGGIYTGLFHSQTENNLILSCDIPFISKKLIQILQQNHSVFPITLAKHKDKTHYLIGCYKRELLNDLRLVLQNNQLKVKSFVESNLFQTICIEDYNIFSKTVANINTREQLKNYEYEM